MNSDAFYSDNLFFQDLMKDAYSYALVAYEAMENYKGDERYVIALQFLTLSHQYYTELKRFQYDKELQHHELDPFFTAYEDYQFQFKQVIKGKDTNTSWLFGAYRRLKENWSNANQFITNFAKNYNQQR